MQNTQLINDYKKIIDSSVFSPSIISLGQFASRVERNEDGSERTVLTIFASAYISPNRPTELMDITTANMIFSMFDLLLEASGKLQGDTFRQRCLSLNVSTTSPDNEKIQEFVYRVLKQIRNAVVHNIASITLVGDIINASYSYRSTAFNIQISKKNLEKVLQLAYLFSFGVTDELQRLPAIYLSGVLASIYDKLVSEIVLSDDINHAVYPLNTTVRISALQREQHIDTKYEVFNSDFLKIKSINHPYVERYPIDYILTYDGKEYIVPFEILDQDNKIPISELHNWAAKM